MKRLLAAEAQGFAPSVAHRLQIARRVLARSNGRRALGRDTSTENFGFVLQQERGPLANAASKSNCRRTCATNIPGNQSVFALVSVARVLEPYEPDLRARGSAPEESH